MNLISMLVESIRVGNRLENAGPRSGFEQAELFATDFCASGGRNQSQDSGLEKLELIDSAFMKPF